MPRADIGILAGVNNNFGTVNNVYNIGGHPAPEPEIVDLRDIQDGLNDRFPERIPAPPRVPYFPALATPRQIAGPSFTQTVNKGARILGLVFLVLVVIVVAAFLWA